MENSSTSYMPADAEISFSSEVYTYKIILADEDGQKTFLENFSPIVVIDELYRPGQGVKLKEDFYAIWREDIKTEKIQMLQIIQSRFPIKHDLNDLTISAQHKTHPNLKENMLITENEKWERRKDLTGVVLKIVTNAVYFSVNIFVKIFLV